MSRLYYLDAMRSILMMLGIVLHAAVIFSSKSWIISDSETSATYNIIIEFIHLFRMPAFFIVSGFFCYMTLSRYGSRLFLKLRIPRILIPLAVTALTLNSLQNMILSDYRLFIPSVLSVEYLIQGVWVSHLWFLISLIYYFIFSAGCYLFFRATVDKLLLCLAKCYLKSGAFSLIFLSFASLIATKSSYLVGCVFPDGQFDWVLSDTISYSAYFFFGVVGCHNRKVLDEFSKFSYATLILTLFFICGSYWLLELLQESYVNFIEIFVTSLWAWLLCYLCFILFKFTANKASRIFSFFSGASYSIYLFHHLIIIFYASIIIKLDFPHWLMYMALMMSTLISTIIIHHFVITKSPIIKFLFNGKK